MTTKAAHSALRARRTSGDTTDQTRQVGISLRRLVPFLYLVVLVGRGWGSWHFLHLEDAVFLADIREVGLWSSFDNYGYLMVPQRLALRLALELGWDHLPLVLFLLATAWWMGCCAAMQWALETAGIPLWAAVGVPLSLTLLPLPDVAYQGFVSALGWPSVALFGTVVVASATLERVDVKLDRGVAVSGLVAAVSHPLALGVLVAGAVLAAARRGPHGARRAINLCAPAAALVGSWLLSRRQEAPLAWLREWAPADAFELATRDRLIEAGAFSPRRVDLAEIGEMASHLPGSLRFLLTQMIPEPWASRWILETATEVKLGQSMLILVVLFGPLAFVLRRWRSNLFSPAAVSLLISGCVVAVTHLLVGQIALRQYLFEPVFFYWAACILAIGTLLGKYPGSLVDRVRSIAFLPVLLLAAMLVVSTFRDPFTANPRQGGTGRYASFYDWGDALAVGRARCRVLSDRAFVLLTQVDQSSEAVGRLMESSGLGAAWLDHPIVLRCRDLRE